MRRTLIFFFTLVSLAISYSVIKQEAFKLTEGKNIQVPHGLVVSANPGSSRIGVIFGYQGGSTHPTTVFQIITNVIEYSMNLLDALDTERFHNQWLPDRISYEKNPLDSVSELKLKTIGDLTVPRSLIGSVNALEILENGDISAKAD
jgi:gamma-glutamyltranspeptidase